MIDILLRRFRRLHMIGIGGSGMSGIAEILLSIGFRITGSDMNESDTVNHLRELGAIVHIGHKAEYVRDAEVVVYSSAVPSHHVEMVAARERKIPVIRRAEMLSELMRVKAGIAISGVHGKTTTTSLVGEVLIAGLLDPTVIVGGKLRYHSGSVHSGKGEFLVTEADEYDQSFLSLSPTLVVITNIDHDHLECYDNSYANLEQAFIGFANSVPFYGRVFLCLDEPSLYPVLSQVRRPVVTYGLLPQADIRASRVRHEGNDSIFTVEAYQRELGEIKLPLPGRHNVLNALAAIAVGYELGVKFEHIRSALEGFEGVHRRFEIVGEFNKIMLVTDFAHHPSEISATLSAAKSGWNKRIVALFQPHLFSRTQALATEFGQALLGAEVAIALPIFPAREEPIEGVTSQLIVDAARDAGHKNAFYYEDKEEAVNQLKKLIKPDDMVLVLGAGDIYRLVEQIREQIA